MMRSRGLTHMINARIRAVAAIAAALVLPTAAGAMQAPAAPPTPGATPPTTKAPSPAPKASAIAMPGTAPVGMDSADVVIIPLKGDFGYQDGSIEWIDPEAFQAMIRQAKSLKPRFVVLDIESPGGRVSVMNLVAESIMNELPKGSGPVAVAWPGVAGSAASFITLTCPRIVVKPTARVGAALTVVPTPKGFVAVEDLPAAKDSYSAKIRSFNDAFERLAMQYGGHPTEVRNAMATRAATLYWSPSQAKFVVRPPDPKKPGDLEEIDTADSVLTLTGPEMLRFKLAEGQAADQAALLATLGLPASAKVARLGSELPEWQQAVRTEAETIAASCDLPTLQALVRTYVEGLGTAVKAQARMEAASAELKGTRGDPRAGDELKAAHAQARRDLAQARSAAGNAKIALEKLESDATKALARIRKLGAAPDLAPLALSQVPELKHSFDQFKSSNLQAALDAVRSASNRK